MAEIGNTPSPYKNRPHQLDRNTRIRLTLIEELAAGVMTHEQLSEQYDVSRTAITMFAGRHREAIERKREGIAGEFDGLWIAKKSRRIAEYQDDVELANAEMKLIVDKRDEAMLIAEHGGLADVSDALGKLGRLKHRAIQSTAEELGQLPSRVQVNVGGERVRHIVEVEGANIDDV